jgi:hypothetical protein
MRYSLRFRPDSSTFSNATEVASVTFFALAGIDWLPNAFVQFPFLLYTDPQGDFHDLTFNDSNVTSFNCNDGAPCDASTSLRYLDSNITAGFGTVGTVPTKKPKVRARAKACELARLWRGLVKVPSGT